MVQVHGRRVSKRLHHLQSHVVVVVVVLLLFGVVLVILLGELGVLGRNLAKQWVTFSGHLEISQGSLSHIRKFRCTLRNFGEMLATFKIFLTERAVDKFSCFFS
jgi:hypothetical protein